MADETKEEQIARRKAELTRETLPEGWVKLAVVSAACRANGIPVSRFIRAFGNDRGINPPAAPEFQFIYFGRVRYCPPEALTAIAKLKDPEFLRLRAKKEKAEVGPAADANKKAPPEARRVAVRPQ